MIGVPFVITIGGNIAEQLSEGEESDRGYFDQCRGKWGLLKVKIVKGVSASVTLN